MASLWPASDQRPGARRGLVSISMGPQRGRFRALQVLRKLIPIIHQRAAKAGRVGCKLCQVRFRLAGAASAALLSGKQMPAGP